MNNSMQLFRFKDQINAMEILLNNVKINSHFSKRAVKVKDHVNKRSAVDGNEKVIANVFDLGF